MYKTTVDEEKLAILQDVNSATAESGIDWFLCGAFSRVLLCEGFHGLQNGRGTYDLDFAICVKTLEEFTNLRSFLCEQFPFEQDPNMEQRLIHTKSRLLVDLIPFGEFARPDNKYFWAPDNAFEMYVQGYDEALSTALVFEVNNELRIRLAGYAEQFLLKLFAWKDRRTRRGKDDAQDLAYFLKNAEAGVPRNDFHTKYSEIHDALGYYEDLTSIYILGSNIKTIFSGTTVKKAVQLIENELINFENSAILTDMYDSFLSRKHPEEYILKVLKLLVQGMTNSKLDQGR